MLLDVIKKGLIEVELIGRLVVALEELDCKPAEINRIDLVLNGLLDVGDRVLKASVEDMRQLRRLAFLCGLDAHLSGLHRAVAVKSGDLDDLAAELLAELLDVDLVAVLPDQVHHVDGDDHRKTDLDELCCEIKVTLDVCSIDDIQDDIGLIIDEVISCDDFLECVRAQGINTRKVLNDDILVSLQTAFLFFDSNTRPVTDVLCTAGQVVEQRCLAAVRVSGKSNFDL